MFAQLINKYTTWRKRRIVDQYTLEVERLSDLSHRPEEYPILLKEFYRNLKLELLDDVIIRDLIGLAANLRHTDFPQLQNILLDANNAIANEKDSLLEYVIRTGLRQQKEVDLDRYFYDPVHGYLNVKDCVEQIGLLLQAHCGILENIEGTYAQRKMLHVYYDLQVITELIVRCIYNQIRRAE